MLQKLNTPAGRVTLTYFATFIILGMTTASLGPTIDALAEQTNAGIEDISLLFPLRSFGYLLGSLLAGRLYDRMNGHRLMGGAMILLAVTMAVIPTVPLFIMLLVTLLSIGISEGLIDVGGNTLIVWLHGKRVGPYMNALHFFFGVGALLAPLTIGWVFQQTAGITWAYWLIALSTIPAFLAISKTKSPTSASEKSENNAGAESAPSPRLLFLLVLFFILYVAAEVSFGGWIYLYAVNAIKASAINAAYINAAFWGAYTIGRLIGIPINALFKPRQILQFDFAGALISILIILIWPNQTWAIWAGSIGFGLSIASIFPTMITYAGSRMVVTGRITGYFFIGSTIGGMVLPWLIGQFFETIGPTIMPWSIAVSLILAVFAATAISTLFGRQASILSAE